MIPSTKISGVLLATALLIGAFDWNNLGRTFDAGYSHFFAGSYLGETGAQDDADFGYVQATITF